MLIDWQNKNGSSFFLHYLHKSLLAVHDLEAFRCRIESGEVFIYEDIKASATISRPDGTFGFSYIPFHRDFTDFEEAAKEEISKVQASHELNPSSMNDVIHYSSVPWVKFTALTHARKYSRADSIPKISFGKLTEENGKKTMPVSIFAHHALMDGYHVGQYLDRFQNYLDA